MWSCCALGQIQSVNLNGLFLPTMRNSGATAPSGDVSLPCGGIRMRIAWFCVHIQPEAEQGVQGESIYLLHKIKGGEKGGKCICYDISYCACVFVSRAMWNSRILVCVLDWRKPTEQNSIETWTKVFPATSVSSLASLALGDLTHFSLRLQGCQGIQ